MQLCFLSNDKALIRQLSTCAELKSQSVGVFFLNNNRLFFNTRCNLAVVFIQAKDIFELVTCIFVSDTFINLCLIDRSEIGSLGLHLHVNIFKQTVILPLHAH